MSYEIYLLGNFKILKDGAIIEIPYKKISYIIAYLAIEGRCNRNVLSELFWESYDNQLAKKNLRNAVYNIKKILGDEFLITYGRVALELNRDVISFIDYSELVKCREEEYIYKYKKFLQGYFLNEGYNIERWTDKINEDLLRKYSEYSINLTDKYVKEGKFNDALSLIFKNLIYNAYDEKL